MERPIIGWEQESPAPNHTFNDYLSSRDGYLYYEDLNLAQLFLDTGGDQGLGRTLPSPLEIVYLPKIREKIDRMGHIFAQARAEVNYSGQFHYAYASKANAAEEVVRTTLEAGAHHEMSSTVDVEIARIMKVRGHLPPDRMLICNGFKPPGTEYVENIVRLKREHDPVIPVVESLDELPPLIDSGLSFEIGLRQKSYGPHQGQADMDGTNSRFGMDTADLERAAQIVADAPNLTLKLYHAMVGSQIVNRDDFLRWLRPPTEIYARLRQQHSSLSIFNFGGGVPVPMTLNFTFDYRAFARSLLAGLKQTCADHAVPPPDVMGEFGRYTTAEHGAHLFKVITVKRSGSPLPWYIIDGSIMTSFPDSWALSEHFILLPLNHLDRPFRRVQLGGVTCDSDDVYPPEPSQSPLYLPEEAQDLYVGFFAIGAYQEMLGGVRGSKHCVLPEANELIVDRDDEGHYLFEMIPGQNTEDVLDNLGYASRQVRDVSPQ